MCDGHPQYAIMLSFYDENGWKTFFVLLMRSEGSLGCLKNRTNDICAVLKWLEDGQPLRGCNEHTGERVRFYASC